MVRREFLMTQDVLLLVYFLVIVGLFSSRLTLKLAPALTELPLKTILATLLALLLALAGSGFVALPPELILPLLVAATVYVAVPLALPALARAGSYALALGLANALYWSEEGRRAVRRLLAQVALQKAEAEVALKLAAEDDELLRIQAYALQERWHEVLNLRAPDAGDNAFLAHGARIWALSELGELERAEEELAEMRENWQSQGQGPIGYRSLSLAEARMEAARGNFEGARQLLERPLPGVPPYLILMILARAAERAHAPQAVAIYEQAYSLAPQAQRPRIAERLASYGRAEPEVGEAPSRVSIATVGLALFLLVAYGFQLWLDAQYPQLYRLSGSFAASAFLLNLPFVPEAEAGWRALAYAFVHGGLIHIGFNTWVLYDIGRLYEARRSAGNLLASFMVGTLAGAYLTSIVQAGDQLVLVGASGGVLGVAGALLADTFNSRHPGDRMLTRSLFQWIVLIMLLSFFIPQVSLWGHAGGILGGLFWGFLRQALGSTPGVDRIAGALSLLVMLYALVMVAQWLVRYG
jgi:rhomboid protease GluP